MRRRNQNALEAYNGMSVGGAVVHAGLGLDTAATAAVVAATVATVAVVVVDRRRGSTSSRCCRTGWMFRHSTDACFTLQVDYDGPLVVPLAVAVGTQGI